MEGRALKHLTVPRSTILFFNSNIDTDFICLQVVYSHEQNLFLTFDFFLVWDVLIGVAQRRHICCRGSDICIVGRRHLSPKWPPPIWFSWYWLRSQCVISLFCSKYQRYLGFVLRVPDKSTTMKLPGLLPRLAHSWPLIGQPISFGNRKFWVMLSLKKPIRVI